MGMSRDNENPDGDEYRNGHFDGDMDPDGDEYRNGHFDGDEHSDEDLDKDPDRFP